MESHAHSTTGVEMGMGGSSTGTHSGSRWSPTKEQISILENLFEQGIRTPTAEQIQKITTKLRAYGHIEGKNVFYWFQNHKARQRQKLKQKQETIASCFNRVNIPTSQPIFSSPLCQNDVYWLQQNGINYCYSQQPNVLVAGSLGMPGIFCGPQIYEQSQHGICDYNFSNSNQETLTLFPLHPTGILEAGKTKDQLHSLDSISIYSSFDTPSGSRHVDDGGRPENKPLIDFFTSIQESRGSRSD